MKFFIKLLSFFAVFSLVLIGISIIPMSSVPEKMLKSSNIKPISISDYGYIDLLRLRYLVKDFSYIAKIEDGSYMLLKAKKIGSGIFSSGDVNIFMEDCNIYFLTQNDVNDILPIATRYLGKDHGKFNIDASRCAFTIKKISENDIKEIEEDGLISENKMTQTVADIGFYGEEIDFSLIKDDFVTSLFLSGLVNKKKIEVNLSKNSIENNVDFKLDGGLFKYKQDIASKSEIITGKIDNIGGFVENFLCTKQKCVDVSRKVSGGIEINLKNNNGWGGKISGVTNADVKFEDGILKIIADKFEITNQTNQPKANDLYFDNKISIYSILEDFFKLDLKIQTSISGIKYFNLSLSDLKFSYDQKAKKISLSALGSNNLTLSTIDDSVDNFAFNVSNIDIQKFIEIIGFDEDFLLDKPKNSLFDCNFAVRKNDYSVYFSEAVCREKNPKDKEGKIANFIKPEDKKQENIDSKSQKDGVKTDESVIDLTQIEGDQGDIFDSDFTFKFISNSCVFNCNRAIYFNGIDIWEFLSKDKLMKYLSIDKYVSKTGISQSALIYDQKIEQLSKDFEDKFSINFTNSSFGNFAIKNGSMLIKNSMQKRFLSFEKFDSNLISGDASFEINLSSNARSNMLVKASMTKLRTGDLLTFLYQDINPSDITILPPSLIGFDGVFDLSIDDISDNFSKLKTSGKMDNGTVSFTNGVVKFKDEDAVFNMSLSLVSKPTVNFGIGFSRISSRKFLPIGSEKFASGICSVSGSLDSSGFTWSEILSNLKGSLSGKVYNLTIEKFNLQALSNKLMDVKNVASLSVDSVVKSGALAFKEADLTINLDKNLRSASISNAKTTGASMSSYCEFKPDSMLLGKCSGSFSVLGLDLSNMQNFFNLQISFAASGSVSSPQAVVNFDQILQYKQQAMKRV